MFPYRMRWKWVGAIAIKNCRLFGSLLYFATDKNMNNFFYPGCEAMGSIVASPSPIQPFFFLLSKQKYFMASSLHRPLILNTIGEL